MLRRGQFTFWTVQKRARALEPFNRRSIFGLPRDPVYTRLQNCKNANQVAHFLSLHWSRILVVPLLGVYDNAFVKGKECRFVCDSQRYELVQNDRMSRLCWGLERCWNERFVLEEHFRTYQVVRFWRIFCGEGCRREDWQVIGRKNGCSARSSQTFSRVLRGIRDV